MLLYLDAAAVIQIADGKDEAGARELLARMQQREARLVVSRELLQDTLSRSSPRSRERVVAAIERFGSVALATRDPLDFESDGESALPTSLISNIRAYTDAPEMETWMQHAREEQEQVHEGFAAARELFLRDPHRDATPSGEAINTFLETLTTRLRGRTGLTAEQILNKKLATASTLSNASRGQLVTQVRATDAMLGAIGVGKTDDLTDLIRSLGKQGTANSPGTMLLLQLSGVLQSDAVRQPRRSDYLDLLHAAYFPYVDVCTCDGFVMSLLSQVGFHDQHPAVKVVRNGNLSDVAAALE